MATFTLSGQLRIVPTWADSLATTTLTDSVTVFQQLTLADGDGAGEADGYWRDVRSVAATTTDTITLASLPLSVFGGSGTLDLDELKLVYVRNLSATLPLQLRFGYPTAQVTTDMMLRPGALLLLSGGTALQVDSTAPTTIEVENQGATAAQYEIVLVGVQA